MTTIDQLKQLIHEQFDVALDIIDPDALFSTYNLDSLTVAELMFAIDDKFHVEIPDTAATTVTTLRGLADMLDEMLAAKAAAASPSAS
jgi:acyl carrier protein